MGFIMLRLARVVSQCPAQNFSKLSGFNLWKLTRLSGVFPPVYGHFFKRVREREVKLRHVVYEVWWVSHLFFSFQIWYFRKWIITSIGQSKHMRVTRFNPLWVSAIIYIYRKVPTVTTLDLAPFRYRNSRGVVAFGWLNSGVFSTWAPQKIKLQKMWN